VEVNLYDSGNECKNFLVSHEGVEYTLLQLHFHSPAEHTIGFEYFDAEVHLVHKSESGKLLIVGVFLKVRRSPKKVANNEFLNRLWTAAGAAAGSPGNTSGIHVTHTLRRDFMHVLPLKSKSKSTINECYEQTLIWPLLLRVR
jgi:carbonic anhydrase